MSERVTVRRGRGVQKEEGKKKSGIVCSAILKVLGGPNFIPPLLCAPPYFKSNIPIYSKL